MHSWISDASPTMIALSTFGFAGLGILTGGLVARLSLVSPFKNEVRRLESMRDSGLDTPEDIKDMGLEIRRLTDIMNERAGSTQRMLSRANLHVFFMVLAWITSLYLGASLNQAFAFGLILTIIGYLSAVDIDHCFVPERPILAIGLFMLGCTLSLTDLRWTSATAALIGMGMTGLTVGMAITFQRGMNMAFGRARAPVLFGDGDFLVLLALSLYFGVDTLAILFLACMVSVPMFIASKQIDRLLHKMGHYPGRGGKHLPFLPAIFIGVLAVIVIGRVFELSMNSTVQAIYHAITIAHTF